MFHSQRFSVTYKRINQFIYIVNSEANTFYCATCSNWFLVKSSEDGNAQQYSPQNKGVYGMFKDDMRLPKNNVGGSNDDSRVMDPRISNSHSPSTSSSKGHSKLVIMEHVCRNVCVCMFVLLYIFCSLSHMYLKFVSNNMTDSRKI